MSFQKGSKDTPDNPQQNEWPDLSDPAVSEPIPSGTAQLNRPLLGPWTQLRLWGSMLHPGYKSCLRKEVTQTPGYCLQSISLRSRPSGAGLASTGQREEFRKENPRIFHPSFGGRKNHDQFQRAFEWLPNDFKAIGSRQLTIV
jgi:hypothetical protein